jgi:hypothetical protein
MIFQEKNLEQQCVVLIQPSNDKTNYKFYLYVLKHNFVELFTYSICYIFV